MAAEVSRAQAVTRTVDDSQSLQALSSAIRCGRSIETTDDGRWSVRWDITQRARAALGYAKQDDLALARFFERYLDTFEVKSAKFKKGIGASPADVAVIKEAHAAILDRLSSHFHPEQTSNLDPIVAITTWRAKHLDEMQHPFTGNGQQKLFDIYERENAPFDKAYRQAQTSSLATLQMYRLQRQIYALQYRQKSQKEIYAQRDAADFRKKIEAKAGWLEQDLLFWKRENEGRANVSQKISERDKEKIEQICLYPEFVLQLEIDPVFRNQFYNFVFRWTAEGGKDVVDIAIQLPFYCSRLALFQADKAEGRLHDLIRLQETNQADIPKRKFVSILMNGEEVDLCDYGREITFDRGTLYQVTRTVAQVCDSFLEKKNGVVGEYSCIAKKGVVRANGPINPQFFGLQEKAGFNLYRQDWYKQLPALETLTKAQVTKRYGVEPEHALVVVRALSDRLPKEQAIEIGGSSSWIELISPRADGSFDVYPIAKQAPQWPMGMFSTLKFIYSTQKGLIRFADEALQTNGFHAGFALQVTQTQVIRFWEKIRSDILAERRNELVF
ncbi:MAG TPA: hypothetical protein VN457_04640, partial [Chlamydiales bacterium]|nr:hypothetical protein [Chlamydiales bacterium]